MKIGNLSIKFKQKVLNYVIGFAASVYEINNASSNEQGDYEDAHTWQGFLEKFLFKGRMTDIYQGSE